MPEPVQPDPTPVILARMETKLDNALAIQAQHASEIDRHDLRLGAVENRASVMETTITQIGAAIAAMPKSAVTWGQLVAALGCLTGILAAISGLLYVVVK